MKLSFFKVPQDYSDYTFWRSEHHRYALYTMFGAFVYSLWSWTIL